MAKAKSDSFKLPRAELLAALETVAPAVAAKNVLEELMHVWFDGTWLTAYNDNIGISVEFKSPFKGGIRGAVLLGVMQTNSAKEVEFVDKGQAADGLVDMTIKAAGTLLDLTMMPIDKGMFEFPEFDTKGMFAFGTELVASIDKVLLSAGQDTSVPDQLGVTFLPGTGGKLELFTTDSRTLSRVIGECPKGLKVKRAVVPTVFCEQLLRLCKKGGKMLITEDTVVATSDDGATPVRIFAPLIHVESPVKFEARIDEALPASFVPVPDELIGAIDRACMMMESHPGEAIDVSVKKGKLYLYLKAKYGVLDEELKLDGKHADIEIQVDPTLIKRALPKVTQLGLSKSAICMQDGKDGKHSLTYAATSSL